jgi:CRP/FNR family nitrogen fixation transcriptional regulator
LVAFYLPGDCFGLEGREQHVVSAEATTDSKIRVIKRKALMTRNADAAMVRYLLALTAEELCRSQRHNLLLLRGAQDRVVGFLREIQERGHSQNEFALHMTRRDIADYLGLTIETVSRTLSRLEAESAISLPTPWRVVLRDTADLSLE